MKKAPLPVLAGIAALTFSITAAAQQGGFSGPSQAANEGFKGPSATVTISQALQKRDDAPVILQGHITKRLSHEIYEFSDGGQQTIHVKIEKDDWKGVRATPNDKVQLEGEVDRDHDGSIKIDVDRVKLLKS